MIYKLQKHTKFYKLTLNPCNECYVEVGINRNHFNSIHRISFKSQVSKKSHLLSIVGVFRYSCDAIEQWTGNQTSIQILITIYSSAILSKPFKPLWGLIFLICKRGKMNTHTIFYIAALPLCIFHSFLSFPITTSLLFWTVYWTDYQSSLPFVLPLSVPFSDYSLYYYHTF